MSFNHNMALQIANRSQIAIPENEDIWQPAIQNTLPDNSNDLAKLIVWSKARMEALKTCISHADKADNLGNIYQALTKELRFISEATIQAELKLGDFISQIPKATSSNNISGKEKVNTQNVIGADLGSTNEEVPEKKRDQIKKLGLSPKQAETFQRMAKHREIVEQTIEKFRNDKKVITRSIILKKLNQLQTNNPTNPSTNNELPVIFQGNVMNFQPDKKYKLIITTPSGSSKIAPNIWLPKVLKNMSEDGAAYIFIDDSPEILRTYLNAKKPNEIIVVQIKSGNVAPNRIYNHKHKFCLFYSENKTKLNLSGSNRNAIQNADNLSDAVAVFIQQATNKDDIVFDPFADNDELLLVAKKLGRKAYGLKQEDLPLITGCEEVSLIA